MSIRKEALLSSQVEGTQSSLADLLLLEGDEGPEESPVADVEEVSHYLAAMQHGLSRLEGGFPLSRTGLAAAGRGTRLIYSTTSFALYFRTTARAAASPNTRAAVASASAVMPFAATTETSRTSLSATPFRGSRMCEYRRPSRS